MGVFILYFMHIIYGMFMLANVEHESGHALLGIFFCGGMLIYLIYNAIKNDGIIFFKFAENEGIVGPAPFLIGMETLGTIMMVIAYIELCIRESYR